MKAGGSWFEGGGGIGGEKYKYGEACCTNIGEMQQLCWGRLCVCVRVRACVCVCARARVCVRESLCACVTVSLCLSMHVCVCMRAYVCVCA